MGKKKGGKNPHVKGVVKRKLKQFESGSKPHSIASENAIEAPTANDKIIEFPPPAEIGSASNDEILNYLKDRYHLDEAREIYAKIIRFKNDLNSKTLVESCENALKAIEVNLNIEKAIGKFFSLPKVKTRTGGGYYKDLQSAEFNALKLKTILLYCKNNKNASQDVLDKIETKTKELIERLPKIPTIKNNPSKNARIDEFFNNNLVPYISFLPLYELGIVNHNLGNIVKATSLKYLQNDFSNFNDNFLRTFNRIVTIKNIGADLTHELVISALHSSLLNPLKRNIGQLYLKNGDVSKLDDEKIFGIFIDAVKNGLEAFQFASKLLKDPEDLSLYKSKMREFVENSVVNLSKGNTSSFSHSLTPPALYHSLCLQSEKRANSSEKAEYQKITKELLAKGYCDEGDIEYCMIELGINNDSLDILMPMIANYEALTSQEKIIEIFLKSIKTYLTNGSPLIKDLLIKKSITALSKFANYYRTLGIEIFEGRLIDTSMYNLDITLDIFFLSNGAKFDTTQNPSQEIDDYQAQFIEPPASDDMELTCSRIDAALNFGSSDFFNKILATYTDEKSRELALINAFHDNQEILSPSVILYIAENIDDFLYLFKTRGEYFQNYCHSLHDVIKGSLFEGNIIGDLFLSGNAQYAQRNLDNTRKIAEIVQGFIDSTQLSKIENEKPLIQEFHEEELTQYSQLYEELIKFQKDKNNRIIRLVNQLNYLDDSSDVNQMIEILFQELAIGAPELKSPEDRKSFIKIQSQHLLREICNKESSIPTESIIYSFEKSGLSVEEILNSDILTLKLEQKNHISNYNDSSKSLAIIRYFFNNAKNLNEPNLANFLIMATTLFRDFSGTKHILTEEKTANDISFTGNKSTAAAVKEFLAQEQLKRFPQSTDIAPNDIKKQETPKEPSRKTSLDELPQKLKADESLALTLSNDDIEITSTLLLQNQDKLEKSLQNLKADYDKNLQELNNKINNLKNHIAEQKELSADKINILTAENSDLKIKIRSNQASIENTKKQLKLAHDNEIRQLEVKHKTEIGKLKTSHKVEIENLKTVAKRTKSEIEAVSTTYNSQKIKDLELEIAEANSQIVALESQKEINTVITTNLTEKNKELSKKLTNLESNLQNIKISSEELNKNLKKELARKDLDLDKLAKVAEQKTECEVKIAKLQQELDSSKSSISKQNSKIKSLQAKNKALQQEVEGNKLVIQELQQTNILVRNQYEQLLFISANLENELSKAYSQISTQHNFIQNNISTQQYYGNFATSSPEESIAQLQQTSVETQEEYAQEKQAIRPLKEPTIIDGVTYFVDPKSLPKRPDKLEGAKAEITASSTEKSRDVKAEDQQRSYADTHEKSAKNSEERTIIANDQSSHFEDINRIQPASSPKTKKSSETKQKLSSESLAPSFLHK